MSQGFDRSYIAADPTADAQGFKFAVAQPISGACTIQQTSGTVPTMGSSCSGYELGSVTWNIQKWFEDTQEWILYCAESGNWETIGKAKKKSLWESEDADKKFIRIDVDQDNKNQVPVTADSPSAWLNDSSGGQPSVNALCLQSETSYSGWRNGGSLHICMHALTNLHTFVAIICTRGIVEDTPNCGTGEVVVLNPNDAMNTTANADCTINAALSSSYRHVIKI